MQYCAMEHTNILKTEPVDILHIITDICFESFSRGRSIFSFWVNKEDYWGKHLPLAGKLFMAKLLADLESDLELKGKSTLIIGNCPEYWQLVAFILINGYNVEIPCYYPFEPNDPKSGELMGYLSYDRILQTCIRWEREHNLEWLFIAEGCYSQVQFERFVLEIIKTQNTWNN